MVYPELPVVMLVAQDAVVAPEVKQVALDLFQMLWLVLLVLLQLPLCCPPRLQLVVIGVFIYWWSCCLAVFPEALACVARCLFQHLLIFSGRLPVLKTDSSSKLLQCYVHCGCS